MTKLIEVTSERYLRRLSKEINTRIDMGYPAYYGELRIGASKFTIAGGLRIRLTPDNSLQKEIPVTDLSKLHNGYGTQIVASREA